MLDGICHNFTKKINNNCVERDTSVPGLSLKVSLMAKHINCSELSSQNNPVLIIISFVLQADGQPRTLPGPVPSLPVGPSAPQHQNHNNPSAPFGTSAPSRGTTPMNSNIRPGFQRQRSISEMMSWEEPEIPKAKPQPPKEEKPLYNPYAKKEQPDLPQPVVS